MLRRGIWGLPTRLSREALLEVVFLTPGLLDFFFIIVYMPEI